MIKNVDIISLNEFIETSKLFIDVIIKMIQMWASLLITAIVLIVIVEIVLRLINKKLDRMIEVKRRRIRSWPIKVDFFFLLVGNWLIE